MGVRVRVRARARARVRVRVRVRVLRADCAQAAREVELGESQVVSSSGTW